MSFFVRNAKSFITIEDDKNVPTVDISFIEYKSDYGWFENKETLKCKPQGGWTELKFKTSDDCVRYEDFLSSMIVPSLKIKRKIAMLTLDTLIQKIKDTENPKYYKKLMKSVNILDPTFVIPIINFKCKWQKEFLEIFVSDWLKRVISGCKNWDRLTQFTYDLKVKELQLQQQEELVQYQM